MFLVRAVSFLVLAFWPGISFAGSCQPLDYSVIFVNGILTDKDSAETSRRYLESLLPKHYNQETVRVYLGYNESHLAGLGDWVKSAEQAYRAKEESFVDDFDLKNILIQIHPEIKTRKILLLGHSQGTFYTNELYKYLVGHGVPEESISVYNLATPASFVSGEGSYLTSGNDRLVNKVRELSASFGALPPLPANILLPISTEEAESPWGGHSFSGSYLSFASPKIVSDIEEALRSLEGSEPGSAEEGCFQKPSEGLSFYTQKTAFALGDGVARGMVDAGVAAHKGAAYVGGRAVALLDGVYKNFSGLVDNLRGRAETLNSLAVSRPPAAVVEAVTDLDVAEPLGAFLVEPILEEGAAPGPQAPAPESLKPAAQSAPESAAPTATPTPEPQTPGLLPYPGFGGGGGGGGSSAASSSGASESSPTGDSTPTTEVTAAPAILSPSNNAQVATTSVTISGTAEAGSTISQNFSTTTTTATLGNWSFTFTLPQGTTTVMFDALSSPKTTSASTSLAVFVDTEAPNISASITECAYSLKTDSCLLAQSNPTLSWSTTSSDVQYFGVFSGDTLQATTTATSSTLSISEGAHTLKVVAYDALGNVATSTNQSVEYVSMPLVINEVAWAGTAASASDEWMELYNRSAYTIDMSKLILAAADGVPYLNLSGALASGEYYLIERTADTTISNVTANLVTVFSGTTSGSGLSNDGEQLSLLHYGGVGTTTIDSTPTTASCSPWCGGSATTKASMERKDPAASGAASFNWSSNNGFTKNGTDSAGGNILGTPKSRNSVNLLSLGYYCLPYASTYTEGGYYLPTSGDCTYLSSAFSGTRYGDVYLGNVGSSTLLNGHNLGSAATSSQIGDDIATTTVNGTQFFTAIFEVRSGPAFNDLADFRSFFTTGSAPPHLNYGVLSWRYGTAP